MSDALPATAVFAERTVTGRIAGVCRTFPGSRYEFLLACGVLAKRHTPVFRLLRAGMLSVCVTRLSKV